METSGFSDECAFLISKKESNLRVIREKRKGYMPYNTKPRFKQVGEKVHVWGAISKKGVGPLIFLQDTVTKYRYMELLDNTVLPARQCSRP